MFRRVDRGFTLIEVLVAILILAIASMAVFRTMSASIRTQASLKQHTVAHWVALSQIASLQTGALVIPKGQSSSRGDTTQFNRTWHWEAQQAALKDDQDQVLPYAAVTVKVANDQEQVIDTLSTVIAVSQGDQHGS